MASALPAASSAQLVLLWPLPRCPPLTALAAARWDTHDPDAIALVDEAARVLVWWRLGTQDAPELVYRLASPWRQFEFDPVASRRLFFLASDARRQLFAVQLPPTALGDAASAAPIAAHTAALSDEALTCFSLSSEGSVAATGSEEGTLCVWGARGADLGHCQLRLPRAHEGPITAVHMLVDAVTTGGKDQMVRVWDIPTQMCLFALRVESSEVTAFAVLRCPPLRPGAQEREVLAAGTVEGSIYLWDMQDGELIDVIQTRSAHVTALTPSSDATALVAAYLDGSLSVHSTEPAPDKERGRPVRLVGVQNVGWTREDAVVSCAFSHQLRSLDQLLVCCYSGLVRVWSDLQRAASNDEPLITLRGPMFEVRRERERRRSDEDVDADEWLPEPAPPPPPPPRPRPPFPSGMEAGDGVQAPREAPRRAGDSVRWAAADSAARRRSEQEKEHAEEVKGTAEEEEEEEEEKKGAGAGAAEALAAVEEAEDDVAERPRGPPPAPTRRSQPRRPRGDAAAPPALPRRSDPSPELIARLQSKTRLTGPRRAPFSKEKADRVLENAAAAGTAAAAGADVSEFGHPRLNSTRVVQERLRRAERETFEQALERDPSLRARLENQLAAQFTAAATQALNVPFDQRLYGDLVGSAGRGLLAASQVC